MPPKSPRWDRSVPDSHLLAHVPPTLDRAESLCPSPSTVERAAASDDPVARAIIDAWQFRCPVVVLP